MFAEFIKENLNLVVQNIESDAVDVKDTSINRIFAIDCSWSMSSDLRILREHLKNNIPKMIRDCDTVSIVWFASKGECGILQEGVKVKSLKDLQALNTAIDKWLQPVGMTGFKEPLDLVREVADRLNQDGSISTLTFMTDGYDNQWSTSEIIESMKDLDDVITATTIVEYGYYCNHNLLDKMAETVGGSLVFNKDYTSYEETLTNESQKIVLGGKRVVAKIDHPAKYDFVVAFTDTDDLLSLSVNDKGEVLVPAGVEAICYLTEEEAKTCVNTIDWDLHSLAMIHILSRKMKSDEVIALVAKMGDVNLYKKFINCFSKQDYAEFQDAVYGALIDNDLRYVEGKDVDFAPADDAFTVVDLLNILANDSGNKFMAYDSGFTYNRVSAKRVTKDKAVDEAFSTLKESLATSTDKDATIKTFLEKHDKLADAEIVNFVISEETKGAGFSLNGLVFNGTRPNISFRIVVPGDAILPKNEFNLTSVKTVKYRNFTVIADGIKNITKMPFKLSKASYEKLRDLGLVDLMYSEDRVYLIDFRDVPVINRQQVQKVSAKDFFDKEVKLMQSKAEQKVYKYYNDQLGNEKRSLSWDEEFGKDASNWLKSVGLTTYNGFNPPTVKSEFEDFYVGKELKTKIKSLSNLPTIVAVLKKIDAGKKLTLSDQLMKVYMDKYTEYLASGKPKTITEIKAWIKKESDAAIERTRSINLEIAKTKMSIIVGKAWFTEFSSLDENSLTFEKDGFTFACTADLKDTKIKV